MTGRGSWKASQWERCWAGQANAGNRSMAPEAGRERRTDRKKEFDQCTLICIINVKSLFRGGGGKRISSSRPFLSL